MADVCASESIPDLPIRRLNNAHDFGGDQWDMEEWGAENFYEWEQGLTPNMRRSMNTYISSSYDNINSALRNGEDLGGFAEDVANIDSALAQSVIPNDIMVHRGFGNFELPPNGSIFQDDAFLSTSLDRNTAATFSNSAVIFVPEGSSGAFISRLVDGTEAEVLLPRGCRFKVLGRDKDGRVILRLIS